MECEDIGLEIRAFVEGKESGGQAWGAQKWCEGSGSKVKTARRFLIRKLALQNMYGGYTVGRRRFNCETGSKYCCRDRFG